MATWQDVGIENFRAAVELYDGGHYRSATSRFYYAVFSALTHELKQRHAGSDFKDKRETPGHAQLPGLVETYFMHLSSERVEHLTDAIKDSYRDRIAADYSLLRVDKKSAKEALRTAENIFRYIGVNHERRKSA